MGGRGPPLLRGRTGSRAGDEITVCNEVLRNVENDSDVEATGEVRRTDQADHTAHHADQSQGGLVDRTPWGTWEEDRKREKAIKERCYKTGKFTFLCVPWKGTREAVKKQPTSGLVVHERSTGSNQPAKLWEQRQLWHK